MICIKVPPIEYLIVCVNKKGLKNCRKDHNSLAYLFRVKIVFSK